MTLFGYGITTKAIAKRFGNCTVFDDKFTTPSVDAFGNNLLPSHLFDPDNSDIEITSPGIAPNHPLIKSAKNLISEYDFFVNNNALKIWISGTNGKTTTTQMTYELLKKRGAEVGGNIGAPLAELDENAPIWILETSSFTMHYSKVAVPNIYILLPITPDHISWHGTQQEYEKAKLKPFAKMQEGEMIIAPKKYENVPTDGFFIGYENEHDLAKFFGIDLERLKFKGVFALDACMALAITKALYDEIDYEAINSFVIDGHRQEEFLDRRSRVWVDDSKATNIDAAICAIQRFCDKEIHIILGGDDKGANMSDFALFLKDKIAIAYLIGANATKLSAICKQNNITHIVCDTLQNAVYEMDKNLPQDGIGLLAPAAASLDQFSSYKERGDKFKEFVKNL
jgi:UDP-N-acetylmuramoylalanine--D-glutamate ligase